MKGNPMPARPTPAMFGGRPRTVLTARPVDPAPYRSEPRAQQPSPHGTTFVLRYTAAILGADLHPQAKRVALLLADRADPHTGRIRDQDQLGARALAALLGLGDTATRASLERLRRRGWITCTRAPEGQPTRITLQIPTGLQQPS